MSAVWSGPVFRTVAGVPALDRIETAGRGSDAIAPSDREGLREIAEALPGLAPTLAERGPIVVSREAGRVVSICYRAAGASDRVVEPGIETLPGFRGRGHAVRAAAGWWLAVLRTGGTPVYATGWDNAASLGVARSLGLACFADTIRWT